MHLISLFGYSFPCSSISATLLPVPYIPFYGSLPYYRPLWYMLLSVCMCVCVCATQLSDDVIAHSRAGPAPFFFALWLPTADSSHQHLWCVMAGAQTRPPGLCKEQSRRCAHTSDRCTRCHYPPLIIILPVLDILGYSLAFYPAWLQNSCSPTRFLYLSSLSPASLSMAFNAHQKWHQKAGLWAHFSRK